MIKDFKVPATSASVLPSQTTSTASDARGGPNEVICVRRVLEYTGTRHWIEETLRRSIPGLRGGADGYRCAFGTITQVALLEFQVRPVDKPLQKEVRRGKARS